MANAEVTIILCGGAINYSTLPLGYSHANAMIPVNGKPVIGWILDDLLHKGIRQATVVLRANDTRFADFLRRVYAPRMDLSLALLHHEGSILESLQSGLLQTPSAGLVRIILGDTLIRDSFEHPADMVYIDEVDEARRWCVAFTNAAGVITELIDKPELPSGQYQALSGYYHLHHGDHLRDCLTQSLAQGERELSRVLMRYHHAYPIHCRRVEDWYDFGNIDHLVEARRRLLSPRYFNALSINPVLNTITKVSAHDQKLQDELDWFLKLPEALKVLTPRIVSHHEIAHKLHIVQEYYGYPTLAELYVYADLDPEIWVSILRHVLRIHLELRHYQGVPQPEAAAQIYGAKTWERLDALRALSPYWEALLELPTLTYNGRSLRNLPTLRPALDASIRQLAAQTPWSIIHGDYCFSNILFDVNNQIVRLIDPRGSFGEKGIYGDPRYDIAKLRHSAVSLYDYIVADMFDLNETNDPGGFVGQVYANGVAHAVAAVFDRIIAAQGYDPDAIKVIEGLLFLSMTPLHRDRFQRQKMMYLTGISLLNEVL
ncbi:MAG: phosphotransferase [Anaerolineae bacterium]|nr:phosphotransferase [Anaerolineae bacterium]